MYGMQAPHNGMPPMQPYMDHHHHHHHQQQQHMAMQYYRAMGGTGGVQGMALPGFATGAMQFGGHAPRPLHRQMHRMSQGHQSMALQQHQQHGQMRGRRKG